MGLTVISALVPGLGLLGATRPALRALGLLTGLAAIIGVVSLAYYAATNTTRLTMLAVSTQFLAIASLALIALGLVWVTLITVTHDSRVAARARRLVEFLDGRVVSDSAVSNGNEGGGGEA